MMKRIGTEHLSKLEQKNEKAEEATSELYFVDCTTQLIETVGDARRLGTREVTLIYLSFTNRDISIALAGGGVTLEGGKNGA
jgi:hypothetical protein